MTEGHKHRTVGVPARLVPLLRWPMYHTTDMAKVDASPYPYGPCEPSKGLDSTCWYLSPLSFLHRWTGLTIRTPDAQTGDTDEHGSG